jgi:hypothetical protein
MWMPPSGRPEWWPGAAVFWAYCPTRKIFFYLIREGDEKWWHKTGAARYTWFYEEPAISCD